MNLPRIRFRPEAERELEEAVAWYEGKIPGLGLRFHQFVEQTIVKVGEFPDRFPLVFPGIREAPVSRFPFCVYYRTRPGFIVVLSVFHQARDPGQWQRRT